MSEEFKNEFYETENGFNSEETKQTDEQIDNEPAFTEESESEPATQEWTAYEQTPYENTSYKQAGEQEYEYISSQNTTMNKGKGGKVVKKACAILVSGVMFGAVAGGTLYGTNYLLDKYNSSADVNNAGENTANGTNGQNNNSEKKPSSEGQNGLTSADKIASAQDASMLTQTGENLTVSEIAVNCMPSVVAITNLGVSEVTTFWGTYQQESQSSGSGVIIGESETELIILTNYHVVSGSKELTVVFSFDEDSEEPKAVTANVKGYDAERDIAVISIDMNDIDDETLNSIKIAVIGSTEELKLGDQVVAIGNALGYGQSVTTGIISATNRLVELEGADGTTVSNYCIQTDAAINPGNSGGALLNMNGELIGINSAKVSSSTVEGMGYAIPISDIHDLVNELMNQEVRIAFSVEEQGYLCISGSDVAAEAELYGVPLGAYVNAVYEGMAAAKAGIEVGDIITEVNGVAIKDMTELKSELSYFAGGDEVTLTYMRQYGRSGYEEKEAVVTLNSYDEFMELQDSLNESSGNNNSQNNGNSGGSGNGGNGNNGNDFWDFFGY